MRLLSIGLAWLSVLAAVIGFVRPWAKIDLREPALARQLQEVAGLSGALGGVKHQIGRIAVKVRRGAETITGDLPSLADLPREVSGAQIPQMANQKNAQVVMALAELLTKTRQRLGLKSYAVYLAPGLAVIVALLLTVLGSRPIVAWAIALVCGAVTGLGCWKLLTTNTQSLFIAITIGPGLWLSLGAYAGLAVSAALSGLAALRRTTHKFREAKFIQKQQGS